MKKTIIFCGGGTGGHIFPSISLYNFFDQKGYRTILLTDKRGTKYLKRDFLFSFKLTMSSLWGPFAVLIVLYLFRTPIFFISSICFAYLIGLTGDNAIQFLLAGEKQVDENMEHFGVSSLAIALIMSCMSLAFLTAYFYPPRILGKTLILGFLFSFIGDFWIFRALLRKNLGNDKKA